MWISKEFEDFRAKYRTLKFSIFRGFCSIKILIFEKKLQNTTLHEPETSKLNDFSLQDN